MGGNAMCAVGEESTLVKPPAPMNSGVAVPIWQSMSPQAGVPLPPF